MPRKKKRLIDRTFLGLVVTLLAVGVFIFVSAALSVLPTNQTLFYRILISQLVFAVVGGTAVLFLFSKIPVAFWRKYALYIFVGSIIATLLVFVPGLGFSHGGARRWITLGFTTFQPAELLKFGFVVYFAAWLDWAKKKVQTFQYGLLPLLIMLVITGGILLTQPDTGTFLVIIATGLAMYLVAGAQWRDFAIVIAVGLIGAVVLVSMRPYLLDRLKTFGDPGRDPLGSSYQIRQSLIAVGSGGLIGRGYGQSVQKFDYLPEPIGDSIFAVAAEEFGFVGSLIILILFTLLALRGLGLARAAPNQFSRLLVTGIVILIISQSLINIASVIGVFPLTGLPLIFISHGGTALLIALAELGIVMHISRYITRN